MSIKQKALRLKTFLDLEYGEIPCYLNYDKNNSWQLLFCIMLSAQTTDKAVNSVTPLLFERYPSVEALSKADPEEMETIIHPVGLAKTKAKHIVEASKELMENGGFVPTTRDRLMQLPGVGIKTAGVYLGELFDAPYIPVDTHVSRVSQILGLVPYESSPLKIESTLERLYKDFDHKINIHKQIIKLGREVIHPRMTNKEAWAYINEKLKGYGIE